MRVVHDTADHLSIATRPSWLVMLVGMVMIVMAAILVLGPAKNTTLIAKHTPHGGGYIELIETKLLTSSHYVKIPVHLIKGAEAAPQKINGKNRFYHLNLDVRDGEGYYYVGWFGDLTEAEAAAAAINRYVADPASPPYRLDIDRRPGYFLIAGLSAFIGLVFVFWGSMRIQASFSRPDRHVVVTRRGLFGTWHRQVPMATIKHVDVAGLTGDCQLYMVLDSGRRVLLSTSTDTEGLGGPRRVRASRLQDAERLREFCQIG